MKFLYMVLISINWMGLAVAAPSGMGQGQSVCIKKCTNCQDMSNRQVCLQNCQGQADLMSCRAIKPNIKSPGDANNYGSELFVAKKEGLLDSIPAVQTVIENSRRNFQSADQNGRVDAQLIKDTKEYLQQLGAHAAKIAMNLEFTGKQKGSNVEAVMQIKSLLEKSLRSTTALSQQSFVNLAALRKYANDILLNYKNIYNQGMTLQFMIDQDKTSGANIAQVKGISKAMLCSVQCRAGACGKNEDLFAKCLVNCDPQKIVNCTKAAQKTRVYDKVMAKLNIRPMATGNRIKPEVFQGEGDMGDHDAMADSNSKVTNDRASRLQRLQEDRNHFAGSSAKSPVLPQRGDLAQARRPGSVGAPSVAELDGNIPNQQRNRAGTVYSPMPSVSGVGMDDDFTFDEIPSSKSTKPQLDRQATQFGPLIRGGLNRNSAPAPLPAR